MFQSGAGGVGAQIEETYFSTSLDKNCRRIYPEMKKFTDGLMPRGMT